jgi:hypothetical protein
MVNKDEAFKYIKKHNFTGLRELSENAYFTSYKPKTYHCNTCLHCAYFTLDNSKYWLLNYLYNHIYKLYDESKIMVIYCDTDCLTFAIAGNPNKGIKQGFSEIIINKELFEREKYLFLPNPELGVKDEKKLLGFATENIGDEMIALAPKNYALHRMVKGKWNWKLGMKGCDKKRNKNINEESFKECLNGKIVFAENCGFHLRGNLNSGCYKLQKDIVNKIALSGIYTKGIYLSNNRCAPFIHNKTANDYLVQ